MRFDMLQQVLEQYGIRNASVLPVGNGLINKTWKIADGANEYILQQINDQVFKEPEKIAHNIRLIAGYLKQLHPGYFFVAPVTNNQGRDLLQCEGAWYRMFPFVAGKTMDVVLHPSEAFEAAAQFGRFTRLLAHFDTAQLELTIPHFHDLSLRYRQFNSAMKEGNPDRIGKAAPVIATAEGHHRIVREYEQLVKDKRFLRRVTHHDTKISNVMFDASGKGLCVIDLDTVMPGYFISDVGDMMRTYLSPASEEEADLSGIVVREDFYEAIVGGYYSEMKDELTSLEKNYFFYAGEYMIYMQAIRFLTDHLNNDRYYGARYPGHNLNRAVNQLTLLQRLQEKKEKLLQFTRL